MREKSQLSSRHGYGAEDGAAVRCVVLGRRARDDGTPRGRNRGAKGNLGSGSV